ncbi:DUF4272 domain-containing protein [Paraflavitalea soli]|uniref:DUF4272 domain-containing protein n=1 Tax=Paraflavitalea soli TaxID=2315862 RepID=A0A3B7MJZ7_9BACT|nr:DUF4272 domain-containing protein [Paraflavitalea soli]AXY73623.1 DUF4272 domain-containing protein [Paraflavitalea soli]
MTCTFYSHETGFDKIRQIVAAVLPAAKLTTGKEGESDCLQIDLPGGFLSKSSTLLIKYRQREDTTIPIANDEEGDIVANFRGLYSYVAQLPCSNEMVMTLFLQKITTLNSEFVVDQVQGKTKDLTLLVQQLAREFDAVLFVQPGTEISRSSTQHFLDKHLNLLLDQQGRCNVSTLDVKVNIQDFDHTAIVLVPEQTDRKARSEELLTTRHIKINKHLPCIESAAETILRTPNEIAQRVTVLAIANLVANDDMTGEEARLYLETHFLWSLVTPDERQFFANPTPERKRHESWKSEGIYTLLWSIYKIDELPFPDVLCDLGSVEPGDYPINPDQEPNEFINSITTSRSKEEILDAADLYYRLDWACVDARINNRDMEVIHPGVVYERHYALNWLIRYSDQDWDDVSCDT